MDTTALPQAHPAASAPARQAETASTAPRSGRARYIGVDIARFLAIVGMMATHLVAINTMNPLASAAEQSAGQWAQTLTSGIAAPLFAVLGGLSIVFATRRPLVEGRRAAACASVVVRGTILIAIGLLLGMLQTPVVVVLAYYGVAMILAAPFVAVRSWVVAAVAGVLALAGGSLNAMARSALEVVNEGGSVTFETFGADWAGTLRALLLTGEYPAITWTAYLLLGMLIGRALVSANARGALRATAGRLLGIGAAVAVAAQLISEWVIARLDVFGFAAPVGVDAGIFAELLRGPTFGAPFSSELWAQLVATPHSGSPLDMLRVGGIAAAIIGLLVLIFDGRGDGSRQPGPFTDVFRAAGAAPLTIYTLHVVATALLITPALTDPAVLNGEAGIAWWAVGLGAFGLQLTGALLIGAILSATRLRGPLEALTSRTVHLLTRT